VPYLPGISAAGLDFSKDGTAVAYVGYPDGSLWRSKVDGSQRVNLCTPPLQVFQPRWSPDGKKIAFMGRSVPGDRWHIYVASADGGVPRLFTGSESDYADPDWSPDGAFLIYGGMSEFERGQKTPLFLVDLRTEKVSTLPGSEGMTSPRWSPDGRYIAAHNSQKLIRFDMKERKWTDWARIPVKFKNWSRDGSSLFVEAQLDGGSGVYQLRVDERKPLKLFSLAELRPAMQPFGISTGLAPDDSPLAVQVVGTQEVYALDWNAP
jgi:dipeptidyl aminopeptidase/acylaminoacyl peptidase